HVPLIMRLDGEKLSKRLGSAPLEADQAVATLHRALRILTPDIPPELASAPVADQLEWAVRHWQPERLPQSRQILDPTMVQGCQANRASLPSSLSPRTSPCISTAWYCCWSSASTCSLRPSWTGG